MKNRYFKIILFLVLLVCGGFFYYGYNYYLVTPDSFICPKTPVMQFLQNNIGWHRLTSYKENLENSSSSWLSNKSDIWSLQNIRGYEIIKAKRYQVLENYFRGTDFDHKTFNTLGVKYFVQGKNDPENTKLSSINSLFLVYNDESINIYENKEVMPRAFVVFNVEPVKNYEQALNVFLSDSFKPEMTALIETENPEGLLADFDNQPAAPYQTAEIIDYSPNRIEIITDIQMDGYLVLTDTYYPGWQAYLDGQRIEIYPTDIAFHGLFIPQGKHQVIFKYRPKFFEKLKVFWGAKPLNI